MGKLFVAALLAGAGFWAFDHGLVPLPAALAPPSPAFETYTSFSSYLAHDQYANAKRLAARGAVRTVQIAELRGRRNTRLAISSHALTRDDREISIHGQVLGVRHELVSETASADGATVAIVAFARVCREKSGCRAYRHEVEACLDHDAWKVCSFHESPAPESASP